MKRTLFVLVAVLVAAALMLPACGKKRYEDVKKRGEEKPSGAKYVTPGGSAGVGAPTPTEAPQAQLPCFKQYKEAADAYAQARKQYEVIMGKQQAGQGVSEGEKSSLIAQYQKVIDNCQKSKDALKQAGDAAASADCNDMESNSTRDQNDIRQIETGN